jgi:plasmid maintenance system killer protein
MKRTWRRYGAEDRNGSGKKAKRDASWLVGWLVKRPEPKGSGLFRFAPGGSPLRSTVNVAIGRRITDPAALDKSSGSPSADQGHGWKEALDEDNAEAQAGAGRRSGKQAIVAACDAFFSDPLKPRFLPEVRPTEWNYAVDIRGALAAGRYRVIQRYRSGGEDNLGEEFDARIDRMGPDRFDIYWMRHTGERWKGGTWTLRIHWMIVIFRDELLRAFFVEDTRSWQIPSDLESRLFRKLQMVDDATTDLAGDAQQSLREAARQPGRLSFDPRQQPVRLVFRWDGRSGEAEGVYLDDHSYR